MLVFDTCHTKMSCGHRENITSTSNFLPLWSITDFSTIYTFVKHDTRLFESFESSMSKFEGKRQVHRCHMSMLDDFLVNFFSLTLNFSFSPVANITYCARSTTENWNMRAIRCLNFACGITTKKCWKLKARQAKSILISRHEGIFSFNLIWKLHDVENKRKLFKDSRNLFVIFNNHEHIKGCQVSREEPSEEKNEAMMQWMRMPYDNCPKDIYPFCRVYQAFL